MNGKCMAGDSILPDSSNKNLINPFVHHLELTSTYEKIKAGILTVIVLPIRVCIIIGLLIAAWLLACVGLYGITEEELQEKPLSGWRRAWRSVTAYVLRIMMFVLGFHWVHVKGKLAKVEEAPILAVSPHSSFFDMLPVVYMGAPSVVTRVENLSIPFFGKLINFTQPVYVWREDPNSRQKTIQQIINRANSKLKWSQVLIFPEGTCTNRSCLITFKPGAFYPGVPVQPVLLRYPNKLDTLTWTWEGPGALKLIWLTLVQPHSNCEIEFLPVYHPSEEEKKDPKLYAQNVRKLMANALGVPMADYTYDDCQLVSKAKQLTLSHTSKLLQVLKLRIRLGLNRSHIEEKIVSECPNLLKNTNKKTLLSYEEFAASLEISPTEHALQSLFQLFNENNCNKIDWREYLLSVMLVSNTTSREDMFQLAFKLCGNQNGALLKEDSITVLRLILEVNLSQAEDICNSFGNSESGYIQYSNFEEYLLGGDSDNRNKKKGHSKDD